MARQDERPGREQYGYLCPVDSRWRDNDIYGHINNVVYYSYFDSTINRFLIEHGGLDIHAGEQIAYVVSSGCDYREAAAYPEPLTVGMKVEKLGNSSVRYALALFGAHGPAKATGFVVHVFVDRQTGRPTPLPEPLRKALQSLQDG